MQKQLLLHKKKLPQLYASGYNEGILENVTIYQKRKIQKIKIVEI
jgi:hypothetical protein